jgi:hypothetical protein
VRGRRTPEALAAALLEEGAIVHGRECCDRLGGRRQRRRIVAREPLDDLLRADCLPRRAHGGASDDLHAVVAERRDEGLLQFWNPPPVRRQHHLRSCLLHDRAQQLEFAVLEAAKVVAADDAIDVQHDGTHGGASGTSPTHCHELPHAPRRALVGGWRFFPLRRRAPPAKVKTLFWPIRCDSGRNIIFRQQRISKSKRSQ